MIRLRWGVATETGRQRSINQDHVLATNDLFAVADGMGGHQGGEVASKVAVEGLERGLLDRSIAGLADAVREANTAVYDAAAADPALRGMGTTLVACALVEDDDTPAIGIVNVGDSRLYTYIDGVFTQVTEDHSLVATMVRDGRLPAEQADNHPSRNVITRALGVEASTELDVWAFQPRAGDRLMLCSDGLFNEIDDNRIAATLRRFADPVEAAQELVRLANEAGGRDNISCIVVDVVEGDAAAPSDLQERLVRTHRADPDPAGFLSAGTVSDAPPAAEPQPGARDTPRSASWLARRRQRWNDRPPVLTWRTVAFVCAFLAVLSIAGGAVAFYARNTYFVGFDADAVVVYRGRPGGVLWLDPTLERSTDLRREDLTEAMVSDIEANRSFGSTDDADRFLERMQEQLDELTTTSTTKPTTTATTAPGPSTPTTVRPRPTTTQG